MTMVEMLNGAGKQSLAGWEIVAGGGGSWIGKVQHGDVYEVMLSPCYSWICQIQLGPQGANIMRQVIPVDMFVSNVPVRIKWASRRRVEDFDDKDQAAIAELVEKARGAQKQLIAERAGITLAGAMPPPRGMPGARG
jgi:hypothetical protein